MVLVTGIAAPSVSIPKAKNVPVAGTPELAGRSQPPNADCARLWFWRDQCSGPLNSESVGGSGMMSLNTTDWPLSTVVEVATSTSRPSTETDTEVPAAKAGALV